MNRHVGRFIGYTLGYLFAAALGRISDAVERQAAEERARVLADGMARVLVGAMAAQAAEEEAANVVTFAARPRCLCSHCQAARVRA